MSQRKDSGIREVFRLAEKITPDLPYHNFEHEHDVYKVACKYAKFYNLNKEDSLVLGTAALVHDSRKDEEETAVFAVKVLPSLGYTTSQAYRVGKLVTATKLSHVPKNLLEEILKDSDLDNLGRDDFFEKNSLLRVEQGKQETSDYEWYSRTLNFLKNHKYYTKAAQNLRNAGLKRNMEMVEAYLDFLKGDKYAA